MQKRTNIGKPPNIFSKALAVQIHPHAGTYLQYGFAGREGHQERREMFFLCVKYNSDFFERRF